MSGSKKKAWVLFKQLCGIEGEDHIGLQSCTMAGYIPGQKETFAGVPWGCWHPGLAWIITETSFYL